MKKGSGKSLADKALVDEVVAVLKDKGAEEIVVIDLKGQPGATDWFIICQGDNTTHISAVAGSVIEELKEKNTYPYHQEGIEDGRWALVDYSDVVVHVMLDELREYYSLETIWPEAPQKKIK